MLTWRAIFFAAALWRTLAGGSHGLQSTSSASSYGFPEYREVDAPPFVKSDGVVPCTFNILHFGRSRIGGCGEETLPYTLLQTSRPRNDHGYAFYNRVREFPVAPTRAQGQVAPSSFHTKTIKDMDVNDLLSLQAAKQLNNIDSLAYAQGLLDARVNLEKQQEYERLLSRNVVTRKPNQTTPPSKSPEKVSGNSAATAASLSGVAQNEEGDLAAFLSSVATAAIALIVCILVVAILRRMYPPVYEKNTKKHHGPNPLSNTLLGWLRPTYRMTIDDVERYANLDHAMFMEFTHLSMKICLAVGVPALCILAPLHVYKGGNRAGEDHLSWQGMANVENGSWLYWLHAVTVWYNVLVIQWLIYNTMRNFLPRRWRWMRSEPELQACTVLIEGISDEDNTDSGVTKLFDTAVFGRQVVQSVICVKDTEKLRTMLRDEESTQRAIDEEKYNSYFWRCKACLGLVEPTKEDLEAKLTSLKQQIPQLREETRTDDSLNLNKAFVTFKSRREAEVALKLFAEADEEELVSYTAPIPSGIIWADLQVDEVAQGFRDKLGNLLIVGLIFAILPIVLGISAITSTTSLGRKFPHLKTFFDSQPSLTALWDGLIGSLALSLTMSLIPTILGLIFGYCFLLRSQNLFQLQIQFYYFWFLVLFVLLVTCIGSSVLETIEDIIADPLSVFNLVADSMPYASHFYLNYLPVQVTSLALEFTRYVILIKYRGFSAFYDENRAIEMAEPEDQDFYGMGSRSARMTLLMVIVVTFATISPLITLLGLIYFLLCRFIYGFLFVYAETEKADTGARFFICQLEHVQFGLYIYAFLMAAVLGERSNSQVPGLIAGAALLVIYFLNRRFQKEFKASFESLPFRQFLESSKKEKEHQRPIGTPGDYHQPELMVQESSPTADQRQRENLFFSSLGSAGQMLNSKLGWGTGGAPALSTPFASAENQAQESTPTGKGKGKGKGKAKNKGMDGETTPSSSGSGCQLA